jgi:hypothetical protein
MAVDRMDSTELILKAECHVWVVRLPSRELVIAILSRFLAPETGSAHRSRSGAWSRRQNTDKAGKKNGSRSYLLVEVEGQGEYGH